MRSGLAPLAPARKGNPSLFLGRVGASGDEGAVPVDVAQADAAATEAHDRDRRLRARDVPPAEPVVHGLVRDGLAGGAELAREALDTVAPDP